MVLRVNMTSEDEYESPPCACWFIIGQRRVNWSRGLAAVFDYTTDQEYRVHGSGNSEPGSSFIFGAAVWF